jgi:predicted lipoprotein with Yx(FWY)xxD motif
MNQVLRIRLPAAIAGLLCAAIACGGSYGSSNPGPSLKLATSARVGNYLVDGSGRSLYYFGEDLPASAATAAVSNCSGACAAIWPSFHAADGVVQGINTSDVGEGTRSDGNKQTTRRLRLRRLHARRWAEAIRLQGPSPLLLLRGRGGRRRERTRLQRRLEHPRPEGLLTR